MASMDHNSLHVFFCFFQPENLENLKSLQCELCLGLLFGGMRPVEASDDQLKRCLVGSSLDQDRRRFA